MAHLPADYLTTFDPSNPTGAPPPADAPAPAAAPKEPPAAEQAPKQIAPDTDAPPAEGPTPAGSKVPYSATDGEGNAVPPPGTPPEDANMVHVGDDPAGGNARYYRGPDGDLYHQDNEGNWKKVTDPEQSYPPRPPGSKVTFNEFDEDGDYVPPAGTTPEDAGLTPVASMGNPAYTDGNGGHFEQTPDGKWHRVHAQDW
jgi:hypothetical protein